MNISHDVIIVGGGMVGLALALALSQQTTLSIAVIEANTLDLSWHAELYQARVSAFSLSSIQFFKQLDIWHTLSAKRVSPFRGMHVWDDITKAEIHFDSREVATATLGYIIENNLVQAVLLDKVKQSHNIVYYSPLQLVEFRQNDEQVCLRTDKGQTFTAKLAIAADGAHSWLREQAGVSVSKHSYEQQAIVANVETTLSHDQIARQVFLSSGPLAFLPLADKHACSIVWSLPLGQAKYLMSLDDEKFKQHLAQAFSYQLGDVSNISKRFKFPLHKQQAKDYLASRVVLVGDAAHVIHPLAGQGVNMGLLDAYSLSQLLSAAYQQGQDIANPQVLRRYQRWRKAENAALMIGVDKIKQLFANPRLQSIRFCGLTAVDKISLIKNIFIRKATGCL